MFQLLLIVIKMLIIPLNKTKQDYLQKMACLQLENQILRRKLKNRNNRVRFTHSEKRLYAVLLAVFSKIKSQFTLVKPETVMRWYRNFLKKRWRYPHKGKQIGRPQTPLEIRELVLQIKNENISWGNKRIQGELLKLDIQLDKNTIRRILEDYRKKGKVKAEISWAKFIRMQAGINSRYGFLDCGFVFQSAFVCVFYYQRGNPEDRENTDYQESFQVVCPAAVSGLALG